MTKTLDEMPKDVFLDWLDDENNPRVHYLQIPIGKCAVEKEGTKKIRGYIEEFKIAVLTNVQILKAKQKATTGVIKPGVIGADGKPMMVS